MQIVYNNDNINNNTEKVINKIENLLLSSLVKSNNFNINSNNIKNYNNNVNISSSLLPFPYYTSPTFNYQNNFSKNKKKIVKIPCDDIHFCS
jgi:hypothetical protein